MKNRYVQSVIMLCCCLHGGNVSAETSEILESSPPDLSGVHISGATVEAGNGFSLDFLRPRRRPGQETASRADPVRPKRRGLLGLASIDASLAVGSSTSNNYEPVNLSLLEFDRLARRPPPSLMDTEIERPFRRAGSKKDLECLAQAIYFEARGEKIEGWLAVAHTVKNRVESDRFPNTVCGVVWQGRGGLHQCQFSYFCDGLPETIHDKESYRKIRGVAKLFLEIPIDDLTDGATYFHTTSVDPFWSDHMHLTKVVGRHIFYRESR